MQITYYSRQGPEEENFNSQNGEEKCFVKP
jgi:hypothetical protein